MSTAKNVSSVREFAARNGISTTTVYTHAKAGRLRIQKLGGKSIVTAIEEARFLASLPDYQPGSTTPQAIEASLRARGHKPRLPVVEPKRSAA